MKSISLAVAVLFDFYLSAQVLLIPQGAEWKFYDQGSLQNQPWNSSNYNDASWSAGDAELGYGDGDEQTVVSFGPNSSDKYITTYFRKDVIINNPQQFSHVELNIKRDDGAVVYVNGNEVWRTNMPSGIINFNTPADGTVAWPNEDDWHSIQISSSWFINGSNTIAVEIHQENGGSSDISFDFSMVGHNNLSASVVRGPYLQMATENSIIVRWRTNVPTDSKVNFGPASILLNQFALTPHFTTDHEVVVTGLQPGSTYYYSIGTNNQELVTGNNLYFETLPNEGEEGNYSFVVLGDCGTGYTEQLNVKSAVIGNYGQHFNGVILLGDNAYQSGFDSEYQSNFFNGKYNEIFENTVIWPTPGNHDYNNHIPFSPDPAYYDIFNCPSNGEAGGLASGTEKYYSFNHGNVHFISLDSYDEARSANAAMATWLTNDLAQNQLPWVIAYWHHPPYTKGSHDSDNDNFLDGELVEMREEIIPILEQYGVDLIMNGHSHSYERSMLIDGHYGDSDSFSLSHVKDHGSGDFPNSCPYHKNVEQTESHQGTVYCVMGNSGKISSVDSEWPHPVMYSYTADKVGALILKVEKNRLDVDFYTSENEVFDHFTIVKTNEQNFTEEVCVGENVELNAVWPTGGQTVWNPGNFQSDNYTFQALSNTVIIQTDALGCLQDTFNIVVIQNDSCGYLAKKEMELIPFNAYFKGNSLHIQHDFDGRTTFSLIDQMGKQIALIEADQKELEHSFVDLPKGSYYLRENNTNSTLKIQK